MEQRNDKLAGRNFEQKKQKKYLDLHGLLPASKVESENLVMAFKNMQPFNETRQISSDSYGSRVIRDLGALRQFNILGASSVTKLQEGRGVSSPKEKTRATVSVNRGLLLNSFGGSSHQLASKLDFKLREEYLSSMVKGSRKASSNQLDEILDTKLFPNTIKQQNSSGSFFGKRPSQGNLTGGFARKSSTSSDRENRSSGGIPQKVFDTRARPISEILPMNKLDDLISLLEDSQRPIVTPQ